LFDARTRVYWAVDSFGASIARPAEDAADLDRQAWREGVLLAAPAPARTTRRQHCELR
jgi:hypothetical protein